MTIADQSTVEALLLRPLTSDEAGAFTTLAAIAAGVIAEELPDVTFDEVTEDDAVIINGAVGSELWLPARPVVDVTAASLDGNDIDLDTVIVNTWGPLVRTCGHWGGRTASVAITYSHGLASPPQQIKTLASELVAQHVRNPTNVRQEAIDGYSLTYGGGMGGAIMGLSRAQKRTLGRYKRRITSVEMTAAGSWLAAGSPER